MKNVIVLAVAATLFLYTYARPAEESAATGALKQGANVVGAIPSATNASMDASANAAKDTVGKAVDAGKPAVNLGGGIIGGVVALGMTLASGVASFFGG